MVIKGQFLSVASRKAPSMDFYDFVVAGFTITDTRSFHEDTLRLGHTAYVDGDLVAYNLVGLSGGFNNGDFATQDYVRVGQSVGLSGVVINDPFAKVAFIFQLLNAGNAPSNELDARIVATADQMVSLAAGLAGAGAGAVALGFALEGVIDLYSWLTVDCDGPVAVDQISGPRYVIDAWADDRDPHGTIFTQKIYLGTDSPSGCNSSNSRYVVDWFFKHYRDWAEVTNFAGDSFGSATGMSAATHNGAVHAFGFVPATGVTHARTFTGASWIVDIGVVWSVDAIGSFDLADLPVSAVSFNDRLYVFGVKKDGAISSLAFTVDGGSWTRLIRGPVALQTTQPIATAVFRNRLYLFARDSTGALQYTSTADIDSWNAWVNVPGAGLSHDSAVTAAALDDTLYIFDVHQTGKTSEPAVVVWNSTVDGSAWTGWDMVEGGVQPGGLAKPLDVSATTFRDRVYIASRWESSDATRHFMAVNFSADGANWSGWREPESTVQYQPSATAGLAAVGNHLYIFTPQMDLTTNDNTRIFAH
jgi:hypothetical protein